MERPSVWRRVGIPERLPGANGIWEADATDFDSFKPIGRDRLCRRHAANEQAQAPIVKFVSVPDFINMDMQLNDPRLFDLTDGPQAQLVAEIAAGGPQADINPNVGNFVGTVENGYRGASQVLLEALAAENADFFTVSGDLLYTRWPKSRS